MLKIIKFFKKIKRKLSILYEVGVRNRLIKKNLKKSRTPKLTYDEKKEITKFWKKYKIKPNLNFFKYYRGHSGIKSVFFIPDNIYYSYPDY